jgi:hypothetical protein
MTQLPSARSEIWTPFAKVTPSVGRAESEAGVTPVLREKHKPLEKN